MDSRKRSWSHATVASNPSSARLWRGGRGGRRRKDSRDATTTLFDRIFDEIRSGITRGERRAISNPLKIRRGILIRQRREGDEGNSLTNRVVGEEGAIRGVAEHNNRGHFIQTVDRWNRWKGLSFDYKAIALIFGDNGSRMGDNVREKLCTMNEPFDRTTSYQLPRISPS